MRYFIKSHLLYMCCDRCSDSITVEVMSNLHNYDFIDGRGWVKAQYCAFLYYECLKVNSSSACIYSTIHINVISALNIPLYDMMCSSKFEQFITIGSFNTEYGVKHVGANFGCNQWPNLAHPKCQVVLDTKWQPFLARWGCYWSWGPWPLKVLDISTWDADCCAEGHFRCQRSG